MAKKEAVSGEAVVRNLLDTIRKQHGRESIMVLGEDPLAPIEAIPSGSILLDEAFGIGGWPRGRIVEIYGPESSGKTSVTLHAIAGAQKMGLLAAFIDAEHAFSEEYAADLGVDTDKLLFSQPDNGEQALSIAEMLCESKSVGIIVIDSVAALVPRAEIEGEMGDSHVGLQARLMSQALRKLNGIASDSNTCVVFINQLREKVGIIYGNPEVTAGGKALKFYASVRLDVRKLTQLKDGTEVIGHRMRIRAVKNKVRKPFGTAEVDFLYGIGISPLAELIDIGVDRGVIKKSGAWYNYGGEQLAQGKDNTRECLEANPELREKLRQEVLAAKPVHVKPSSGGKAAASESMDMTGGAPWE